MATRGTLRLLALAAIVCLLLGSQISFADSHVRIVRLSDIEGSVQIDRNTGQGFEKAILNMPITEGMRLKTSSGRAEVEFENGSVLRLADDSSIEFSTLSLRDAGQMVNEVRLNDGTMYVHYKRKAADDFKVEFAKDALNLDKDVHFRLSVYPDTAQIAVMKGELQVPKNGDTAKLKKDQTLNLNLTDQTQVAEAKGITSMPNDHWDSQREAYDTQYQDQYTQSKYPYQYGYTDLSYYGTFFNAPGYGVMWQPFGVGAGWDPFASGAWSFYQGYGYMWVSGYPWGWMPYRYGSWNYVPAYGWAWQPGAWNTVNASPTVARPPVSWRHPEPPGTTAANSTVLVGNVGNPNMLRDWRRAALFQQPNAAMTSGQVKMAPIYHPMVVQAPSSGAAVHVPAAGPSMGTTTGASGAHSSSMQSAPAPAVRSGSHVSTTHH
jgi:FecR protein